MEDKQSYVTIDKSELKNKAHEMKDAGYVLSQISATKKEHLDLLYSFEKEYEMINVRVVATDDDEIESINGIYTHAYLYENEMKDLFGVRVINLDIDFQGNLYKTSVKTPFNTKKGK